MKLVTYSDGAGKHAGVLDADLVYEIVGVTDLTDILGEGLDALLERGRNAVAAGSGVALDSVRLESPVTPPTMRDSMCFHEHIMNCSSALGTPGTVDPVHEKLPAFYLSNPTGVLAPSQDAPISPGCETFDYELEVAAVIGVPGGNIAREDAFKHIIGYTMYIDWSARDLQMVDMSTRLGPGKGKDGATTLGPVLVTADEFEPLRSGKGFDAKMSVAINGEPFSSNNWSTINWGFDDVVCYTSRGTTLRSGDVLGSGTVGRGCLFEWSKIDPDNFRGWLKEGDVVTFEVDLIGSMSIRVAAADVHHPLSSGY